MPRWVSDPASPHAIPPGWRGWFERLRRFDHWLLGILGRAISGTYSDGFMHAGNLAYLSLIALFPFFITAAAIAGLVGQGDSGREAVEAVLATMPIGVAAVVREPVADEFKVRPGAVNVVLVSMGYAGLRLATPMPPRTPAQKYLRPLFAAG